MHLKLIKICFIVTAVIAPTTTLVIIKFPKHSSGFTKLVQHSSPLSTPVTACIDRLCYVHAGSVFCNVAKIEQQRRAEPHNQ